MKIEENIYYIYEKIISLQDTEKMNCANVSVSFQEY